MIPTAIAKKIHSARSWSSSLRCPSPGPARVSGGTARWEAAYGQVGRWARQPRLPPAPFQGRTRSTASRQVAARTCGRRSVRERIGNPRLDKSSGGYRIWQFELMDTLEMGGFSASALRTAWGWELARGRALKRTDGRRVENYSPPPRSARANRTSVLSGSLSLRTGRVSTLARDSMKVGCP